MLPQEVRGSVRVFHGSRGRGLHCTKRIRKGDVLIGIPDAWAIECKASTNGGTEGQVAMATRLVELRQTKDARALQTQPICLASGPMRSYRGSQPRIAIRLPHRSAKRCWKFTSHPAPPRLTLQNNLCGAWRWCSQGQLERGAPWSSYRTWTCSTATPTSRTRQISTLTSEGLAAM